MIQVKVLFRAAILFTFWRITADLNEFFCGRSLAGFSNVLTRRVLKLKCNFIINWKTTDSNSFLSCKDKTPTKYHSSVVCEFTCPGCKSRYIGKTDRCFYTRIKEHARDSKSKIFEHITSCEHFQHIKSILELYPDDQTNLSQTCIPPEFIFNNSKIIDYIQRIACHSTF